MSGNKGSTFRPTNSDLAGHMGTVEICTGKFWPEALIFVSTNPKCVNRLSIESQVQYMKIPGENMFDPCSAKKKSF